MKKLLFIFAATLMCNCGSCVDDDHVVTAVMNQGFTDVKILDKDIIFVSWSGCSGDDEAAYEITAINHLGQPVNLLACAGWPFKGVTVRSK